MEEKISDYINQMRKIGKGDSEIKQALLGAGWTEEMFSPYLGGTRPRKSKSMLVVLIALCCIVPLGVGAYFLFVDSDSDSTETTSVVGNSNQEAVTNTSAAMNSAVNLNISRNANTEEDLTIFYDLNESTPTKELTDDDLQECKAMPDTLEKSSCLNELLIATHDPRMCHEIITVAAYSNDMSICDDREHSFERDSCIKSFAINKEDISICKKINDTLQSLDCYYEISQAKRDVSICDQMKIDFEKFISDQNTLYINDIDSCYSFHAWLSPTYDPYNLKTPNDNIGMCDKMILDDNRDACYSGIAFSNQDSAVCEKVTDEDEREECLDSLE